MKMKAKIFVFLVAALFITTTFAGASVLITSEIPDPEPGAAAGYTEGPIWYFNTDPPEWPANGWLFEDFLKFPKRNREIESGTNVTFVIKARLGTNSKCTHYRMDINLYKTGSGKVFTQTHYWENNTNPEGYAGYNVNAVSRHTISFDTPGIYEMWVIADSYRTKEDVEPTSSYKGHLLMDIIMFVDTEAPLTKTITPMANNLFYLLSNLFNRNLRFKQQNIFNL